MILTVVTLFVFLQVAVGATVVVENRYTCQGNVKGYMQLSATPALTFSEIGTASCSNHLIYVVNRVYSDTGGTVSGQIQYHSGPPVGTPYTQTTTRYYTFPDGYEAYGTFKVERHGWEEDDYWFDTISLIRGIDF